MKNISILAIDLAKHKLQVCATTDQGEVIFNRTYTRGQLSKLLEQHSPCIVAMEACSSSHYWGRLAQQFGHTAKLIPAVDVKAFVKNGAKNDANDALGIATAVRQPHTRLVAVKSEGQQSQAMVFRTHQTFKRQRTQLIVTLRAHLAEYGVIIAKGVSAVLKFQEQLEERLSALPDVILETARLYYHQIEELDQSIGSLETQMAAAARTDEDMRRIIGVPGVGQVISSALQAFAPPMENFKRGRCFAAWLGLVPRQNSSGGKTRLGRIAKTGQSDLRRLLVVGATACLRWAKRKGLKEDSWLARLITRMPLKKVAVAMAGKMARIIWAILSKKEEYRGTLIQYA